MLNGTVIDGDGRPVPDGAVSADHAPFPIPGPMPPVGGGPMPMPMPVDVGGGFRTMPPENDGILDLIAGSGGRTTMPPVRDGGPTADVGPIVGGGGYQRMPPVSGSGALDGLSAVIGGSGAGGNRTQPIAPRGLDRSTQIHTPGGAQSPAQSRGLTKTAAKKPGRAVY